MRILIDSTHFALAVVVQGLLMVAMYVLGQWRAALKFKETQFIKFAEGLKDE